MYYNTTNISGEQLKQDLRNASKQEVIIFRYFKLNREASPSQVFDKRMEIGLGDIPLTSIRRAITTLAKNNELIKTSSQVTGMYGKPEYIWRFPVYQPTLFEQ